MGRVNNDKCGMKDEDVIMRRSPRISVRKVRATAVNNGKKDKPDVKKSRKRKAVCYEDDPSYNDEEGVENESEQRKKVPGYRCSSLFLADLMGQLSPKQKGWVDNIKFSSLIELVGSRPPKSLTLWLVDRVDTKKGTIEVCGEHIEIKKCVKRMLGLPSGPNQVPKPLHGRSKAKVPRVGQSGNGEKHSDHGRGQTAKDAMVELLAENEDEASFCQSFVMLVLCIYLAPTTSLNINRSYYPAVLDVTQISLMDWCGFIADYLVHAIEEYRSSKASHVQVPGCVHLLPLIYLDALLRHMALVFPPKLALPQRTPLVHFVTTEHLAFMASADAYPKSKDRTEYGLLQDNLMARRMSSMEGASRCDANKSGVSKTDSDLPDNLTDSSELMVHVEVLVDSLHTDITESRQQLLNEFQEKVTEHETRTYGVFKQKIKKLLSSYGKNKQTSRGCSGVDSAQDAPQVGKSRQADKTCVRNDVMNPSVGGRRYLFTGTEEEAAETTKEGSLIPEHIRNVSTALCAENIVEGFRVVDGDDTAGNLFSSGSQVGNFEEKLLNEDKENESTFVDELADVVKIGKMAVDDTAFNLAQTECLGKDGSSLNSLSDAVILLGPPEYDASPTVCSPKDNEESERSLSIFLQTDMNSPTGNLQSCDMSYTMENAVFDDSPVSQSVPVDVLRKGKCNLLTISEGNQVSSPSHSAVLPSCASLEQTLCTTIVSTNPESVDCSEKSSELAESANSSATDTDNESESGEIPAASDDSDCYYKHPLENTPDHVETPGYSQVLIDVDELPASAQPEAVTHVKPLEKELATGFRFKFGCSMAGTTLNLLDKITRLKALEAGEEGSTEYKFVRPQDAKDTYNKHVSNSSARVSTRLKSVADPNRDKPKIIIKGYHVTKGEFVDALKPSGEVCRSMMGLCSVAIMTDWESTTRIILDQASIDELLNDREAFKEMIVVRRLLKFKLKTVEEILLPILHDRHWILAVVDLLNEKVDLFDSLRIVEDGENPHKDFWLKVCVNLEVAFSIAVQTTVPMVDFPCVYQKVNLQTNSHDCGFHVIQAMECYKTEDVVGHEKKRSLIPYRRYLCHVLVYHRFNDLNPLREGVPDDIP